MLRFHSARCEIIYLADKFLYPCLTVVVNSKKICFVKMGKVFREFRVLGCLTIIWFENTRSHETETETIHVLYFSVRLNILMVI